MSGIRTDTRYKKAGLSGRISVQMVGFKDFINLFTDGYPVYPYKATNLLSEKSHKKLFRLCYVLTVLLHGINGTAENVKYILLLN